MTELVVTVGLPASGKTTWAKEWVADDPKHRARVERDQLRLMMHDGLWLGGDTENQVVFAQHAMVRALLRRGISVVVSDTNLAPQVFASWDQMADDERVIFVEKSFREVSLDTCLKRNAKRSGREQVPVSAIVNMYNKYLKEN